MELKYKCALCPAEYKLNGFTNHIQRTHKISYKEYYDTYIEPNTEHICKFCGKPCDFSNSRGYFGTCGSDSCVRKSQHITMFERYGKSCRHADKLKPKPVIEYKFHCALCNRGFKSHLVLNRHLNKDHNSEITPEEYYLKYMGGEIKYCEVCGKKAKWLGAHYHNVCGSAECTHKLRVKNNSMKNPEISKNVRNILLSFSDEKKIEIKNKKEETCLKKYGYKHNWSSPEVRARCKQTCLEKYGYENYNNRDGARETCLEYYGVDHQSKCKEIFNKMRTKYVYDGKHFDSKYEIAYYVWLKDNGIDFEYQPNISFEYEYNGQMHKYFPDFRVNDNFVEIKGIQFFEHKDPNNKMINPFDRSQDDLYEAKHQCMIANSVNIITDCSKYIEYANSKNILVEKSNEL